MTGTKFSSDWAKRVVFTPSRYGEGLHGLFLVAGLTRFFLWADAFFLYRAVNEVRRRPDRDLVFLAAVLAVASIYSPDGWTGFTTAIRIVVLASVAGTFVYGRLFQLWTNIGLTVVLLATAMQVSDGVIRPDGLHFNASNLGETGFVLFPISPALSMWVLVFSLSRMALFALTVWAVLWFVRKSFTGKVSISLLTVFALTVFLFSAWSETVAPGRLSFSGVQSGVEMHSETISGLSEERTAQIYDDTCGDYREVRLKPFGYGFRGFCLSTGQPRPHNIVMLSIYELGVLSVLFWGVVIRLIWRYRNVYFWVPLLFLGMGTDEIFGRPEGVYIVFAWFLATHGNNLGNTESTLSGEIMELSENSSERTFRIEGGNDG